MTIYDEIRQMVAPELGRLNARIRERLDSDSALMGRIVGAQLRTHGKQIRPLVVALCARMFGTVSDKVLAAGAAVELLHNASLIHDDVVDESKIRRGMPTVNALWDNHIAVLVGDFFTSASLREAVETGDMRVIRCISDLGSLLSLGELGQLDTARTHALSEDAYFANIEKKTASLFVACARMGCYTSGASEDATRSLAEFGRLLGLCFQIRDDIFDYFPSELVGKPTGNDLREGKVSLPLLHALSRQCEGCGEVVALLERGELTDEEISRIQAFARDNGGIDYAFDVMRRLRREACDGIASLPDATIRRQLTELFDFIIERQF